jgi:3'-5' exoribonuclease
MTSKLPLDWTNLCNHVLNDQRFAEAAGGVTRHHQYVGGLAVHTLDVARRAIEMTQFKVEREKLLVAAVFHDYGKIHEYEIVNNPMVPGDFKIVDKPFRKLIGHVAWSWSFFDQKAVNYMDNASRQEIGHILLSHHGRHEWRSPVEPQTKLAYLFHTADMMSSYEVDNT